ncbi:MAG: metallophosphoesterase [Oscillospiraceae bacterium]|nr:metallophosphoesterase [Oscillospiraceae bacterium]
MKILAVADNEDPYLWDHYRPGRLAGIDVILSAGDLKPEYLSFLVTMANRPLYYVHGNHDGIYQRRAPEGCECIDDTLVKVNGVRILGLGGARLYNGGPYQFSDSQMKRRIRKLYWKLYRARGVDIVLTHAPPAGYGDADDIAHRGFESFLPLLDRYHPRYLIHGHVHRSYQAHTFQREILYQQTIVCNAAGRTVIDLDI